MSVNKLDPEQGPFEDASVYSREQFEGDVKLSSPRAYTLSLSPHLIYSRSSLLPTLISSKVYRQLEFQAVGSWWIQKQSTGTDTGDQTDGASSSLYRVPGTREDVFADDLITVKSKRTLMRFLRHISKDQQGGQEPLEQEDLSVSLPSYLVSKFQVPDELHSPLQSLSLSQKSPKQTPADYAVPRIKRHLASIGVLGPGFGSLLAKWGGGSEIAQVGCRALAVGGGTYVLGAGIHSITDSPDPEDGRTRVQLSNGETVRTKFVVGSHWDLPAQAEERQLPCDKVARSISVVSSSLDSLFAATAEGAPIPAGTVVVFPGNLLGQGDDSPPVYLQAHSNDTGEVPTGQSKSDTFICTLWFPCSNDAYVKTYLHCLYLH
jgi:RAB protein geranylgeranyltransferase component A